MKLLNNVKVELVDMVLPFTELGYLENKRIIQTKFYEQLTAKIVFKFDTIYLPLADYDEHANVTAVSKRYNDFGGAHHRDNYYSFFYNGKPYFYYNGDVYLGYPHEHSEFGHYI